MQGNEEGSFSFSSSSSHNQVWNRFFPQATMGKMDCRYIKPFKPGIAAGQTESWEIGRVSRVAN